MLESLVERNGVQATFVLDTNVLLYDPRALFVFKEHDVLIPITVIEEVDRFKKDLNETGRNARLVSRYMDQLREQGSLNEGVALPDGGKLRVELGRSSKLPKGLKGDTGDNLILQTVKALHEDGDQVVLVTRDTNMRLKADAMGIRAEDYRHAHIEVDEYYSGISVAELPQERVDELYEKGFLPRDAVDQPLHPNQFLLLGPGERQSAMVRYMARKERLKLVGRYKEGVWGIRARNKEQLFALELLLDDSLSLVTIEGQAGTGKAQPLDAKVLTPTGWTTMGEIKAGDLVVSGEGTPTKVLKVFPQGEKEIFRVTFSDGSSTECCREHLWHTRTSIERDSGKPGAVRSLDEIMESLRYARSNKRNHSIPMVRPVKLDAGGERPLAPYLLGCLLGDGGMSVGQPTLTTADDYIWNYEVPAEACKNAVKEALSRLGLWGRSSREKSVPASYLFAPVRDRIALLQGLMDTDGTVSKDGTCTAFSSTSEQLALDVRFLVLSLGGKATIQSRTTSYTDKGVKKEGRLSYRVSISMPADLIPFQLPRKRDRFRPRTRYTPTRYIESVEAVGRKQAQCILVDHPDHLYVTDDFIVTHNTLLAMACGLQKVADDKRYRRLLVSRPIFPMGRDLGFLPGDVNEKLNPWMKPIFDNLEVLLSSPDSEQRGSRPNAPPTYQPLLDQGILEVEPLTYIRGRSLPRQFVVVDEAQNLTPHEVKTVITRAGEGTKVILTGDPNQIDNPYVDATSNGLTYVVERFKDSPIAGHITLRKGERSELAQQAAELL